MIKFFETKTFVEKITKKYFNQILRVSNDKYSIERVSFYQRVLSLYLFNVPGKNKPHLNSMMRLQCAFWGRKGKK